MACNPGKVHGHKYQVGRDEEADEVKLAK